MILKNRCKLDTVTSIFKSNTEKSSLTNFICNFDNKVTRRVGNSFNGWSWILVNGALAEWHSRRNFVQLDIKFIFFCDDLKNTLPTGFANWPI